MAGVDIAFCERRIVEEEALAESAASAVEAASHYQLALLYKAQLSILTRKTKIPFVLPNQHIGASSSSRLAEPGREMENSESGSCNGPMSFGVATETPI